MNLINYILPILLLFTSTPAIAAELISVAGNKDTKVSYQKLVQSKGGNPCTITDFNSRYASRPAISLLLLRQALHLGGLDSELFFISCPNPGRGIAEVKNGRAVVYSSDIWEQDFDDSVYKTEPVLRCEELQKGFYVTKNSPLLGSKISAESLKKHIPLVEHTWTIDIALLKKIGFKKIQTAPQYDLLFKMINRNRADFAILEFPRSNDLIIQSTEGDLTPIQNVKIVIPYSRHFMVSKKHPQGKKVYEALEKGLKILRKNGTIMRAFRQSGVLNPAVENWVAITP